MGSWLRPRVALYPTSPHRQPPRSPKRGPRLEDAGARRPAMSAPTAPVQIPLPQLVPVALDQPPSAPVTPGALSLRSWMLPV